MNDDGINVDSNDCAVLLNNYFTSVFTKEDHSNIPLAEEVDYRYMDTIVISTAGISALIKYLKISTSAGVDCINTKILKQTIMFSSIILAHIFNQSLSTGETPHEWKIGKIIPVFKSRNKSNVSNYRPITLTSVPCKLLEHFIPSNVAQHLEANNFFLPEPTWV